MKKIIYPGAFIALAAVVVAFQFTSQSKHNPGPSKPKVQVRTNPDADLQCKLFSELVKSNDYSNTFISPIATYLGLSMVYNGAAGKTRDDLAKALQAEGLPIDKFNAANRARLDAVMDGRGGSSMQILIASSLWTESGLLLSPDFVKNSRKYYDAEVKSLDFTSPSAIDAINAWAREKTQGKVTRLVEKIDPMDALFVVNAVYFKARWENVFEPSDTKDHPFTLLGGKEVDVKTMSRSDIVKYYRGQGFQLAVLPYYDGEMVIALPDNQDYLRTVIPEFDSTYVEDLVKRAEDRMVNIKLPKFKIDCRSVLNEPLKSIGLSSMFEGADFSNIANGGLFVSEVVQQASITVDEEGTEAGAVNSIEMMWNGSSCSNVIPVDFVVDRPFIFFIRKENTILFTGLVSDPRG